MTIKNISIILLCVLIIAVGQVLFKLAAKSDQIHSFALLANSYLWFAVVLYGAATLLWVWVLKSVPLTLAYPLMALTFILVPLLAHLVLGEPFAGKFIAGGVLISLGVYLQYM